tara:strand:- start:3586 stop:5715 length:2130 start_codon:yes stop_codon:yes gene_type:complete
MKALTTILKSGKIKIIDIPPPQLSSGSLLVQNYYSLISAGTESATIKDSKKGYIGKARSRPDQVKKVIDSFKNQGPTSTYRNVMKKLDAYSPMGYSSAGKIIGIGDDVEGFSLGDYVACSGVGYANHAEVVSVPKNLCIKLHHDANLKNACYNSLGGIAIQSIRQVDMKLGETCAVIGLGLVGQLTCLLLKANGINVIGIDISKFAVNFSDNYSVDLAINRNDESILSQISNFTSSYGVDAVIIAASSNSLDPINFAGEICRDRGKVIILGDVPTGFNRESFYRKELILKMSCSYGPGRYDTNYEEKGLDYPLGQVRWTEKRNMEAFQNLVYRDNININKLTTNIYDLDDFETAYSLLISSQKDYFGLVLKYDVENYVKKEIYSLNKGRIYTDINIGMFGGGSYAQSSILPHISNSKNINKNIIITKNGNTSKKVGEKYGFQFCSNDADLILDNEKINTVFIVTPHDSHANYILECLKKNKNIFCEKPLCIDRKELGLISSEIDNQKILIGYNRRFSSHSKFIKSYLDSSPLMMLCRINAGHIQNDSWIIDKSIGGGRIIGEVCHFVDLFTYFSSGIPISVNAKKMFNTQENQSDVSINISFSDGSLGTILFTSVGSNNLGKEYYELHQNGKSFIIDDFKKSKVISKTKTISNNKIFQDKGQKNMVNAFFENIQKSEKNIIPINEIITVSKTTFAIEESIKFDGKNTKI